MLVEVTMPISCRLVGKSKQKLDEEKLSCYNAHLLQTGWKVFENFPLKFSLVVTMPISCRLVGKFIVDFFFIKKFHVTMPISCRLVGKIYLFQIEEPFARLQCPSLADWLESPPRTLSLPVRFTLQCPSLADWLESGLPIFQQPLARRYNAHLLQTGWKEHNKQWPHCLLKRYNAHLLQTGWKVAQTSDD